MALLDLLPSRKQEAPAPEPVASHKGVLEIGGMIPLHWDTADSASVHKARRQFNSAISCGYMAQSYSSTPVVSAWGGSRMDGEVTREFNPEADVVRMSLPYAGG
jgi:hypothetical protein